MTAEEPALPTEQATAPQLESRALQLLHLWLERTPELRSDQGAVSDFLAEVDEDPRVVRQVGRLISLADQSQDPLAGGAMQCLPDVLGDLQRQLDAEQPAAGAILGTTIDRYRLVEVLGRGGMGVVYEAERADDQFEQRVALKVIPRGLETEDNERRFRLERQILARLEHPHIARLIDGGLTDEGYPYLVMERVDGVAIDDYCKAGDLGTRAKVGLMIDVCRAVHYAHQNLVVHRDLKPSNLLVTAQGVVKLLDFGIGKMLDQPASKSYTVRQPMTPGYASPEQLANQPVSTATDVYSLGAVLHKLLWGERPLDGNSPSGSSVPADLQLIVERALRPDPQERFSSAADLAEDLQRFLDGRAISSRPNTLKYRLGKAVRRNPGVSLSVAAAVLAVVGGATAVTWQARIVAKERDQARLEARRTQQVASLMSSLFGDVSPFSTTGGNVTAAELLERGEARVRSELAGQPALRGVMLAEIAAALGALGNPRAASELTVEAVADLRAAEPRDDLALARALRTQASVLMDLGQGEGVAELLAEARRLLEARGEWKSPEGAGVLRHLGVLATSRGDYVGAIALHREALEILEGIGMTTDAAIEKTYLATATSDSGEKNEALDLQLEALETLEGVYGENHPNLANTRNNIAVSLYRLGRHREAERLYRAAISTSEETLGKDHGSTASALTNLGRLLMDQGRFSEAERPLRRAVELRRETTEPDSFQRIAAELNFASLEAALGELASAIAAYRDALARLERLAGGESAPTARVRCLLGGALHRQGDLTPAERLLRRALEAQRRAGESVPSLVFADTLTGLGAVLSDRGEVAAALPLLREAHGIRSTLPPGDWNRTVTEVELAGALLRASEGEPPAAAERLLTEADEILAGLAGREFDQRGREWTGTRLREFGNLRASRRGG